MANGLSLIFEVAPGASPPEASDGLKTAFTPVATTGPTILHYVWLASLPPAADGNQKLLLTTVYDEEFSKYIIDLVNANSDGFDKAAAGIVGLQYMVANNGHVKDHMDAFVAFVKANDLNQGTSGLLYKTTFVQAYSYSVNQIIGAMGPG
ncbi:MAG: hypothetical protein JWR84_688 [Caulobacter sp.]|nr:hypothetical protein [Caulobacter sp.]